MSEEYTNDDFVYVDPKNRKVVGRVEWDKNGNALEKEMPAFIELEDPKEGAKGKDAPAKKPVARKGRKPKKRYYPWGSYRSMRKVYRLEGKEKIQDQNKPFEEILGKALEQPFWD